MTSEKADGPVKCKTNWSCWLVTKKLSFQNYLNMCLLFVLKIA